MNNLKLWFLSDKVQYEIKSAAMTFCGIFAGTIVLNPIFNQLIGTDLPTIQQLKDVLPVLVDAGYRAAWITTLIELGLYKRK